MRKQIQIFLTALMFYTRIPCPKWVTYSQECLNNATKYFHLIGWIVGSCVAITLGISYQLFPLSISVILAMATGVLITGAFHEDGFADSCDGFGGGWTKAKILDIMKDSRSGAYAVVGTILLFLLKYATLVAIGEIDFIFCLYVLIMANTLSRFAAVYIIYTANYVREDELSKAKPIAKQINTTNFLIATIGVIPPFILFQNWYILLVLLPTFLTTILLRNYYKRWIGGYTGDCLGAAQQVNEIIILLSSYLICKYI